jgi:hypothetical protein
MSRNLFKVIDLLSEQDLTIVIQAVEEHLSLKLSTPLLLSDYHILATDAVHLMLSPKKERVLSEVATSRLLTLPSFQKLLNSYPNYKIGDVAYDSLNKERRPELYFRLVRPHQPSDIGTPHCDFWFHDAVDYGCSKGDTIKFWIPLLIEPGLNGLYFYPYAPLEIPYRIIDSIGLKRPMIDCDLSTLGDPVLAHLTAGQCLMFSDDVLHCGAVNLGSMTRVSMEITLVSVK